MRLFFGRHRLLIGCVAIQFLSSNYLKADIPQNYLNVSGYSTLNSAVSAAVSAGKAGVYIPANYTIQTSSALPISVPNSFGVIGEDKLTSVVNFPGMSIYNGFVSPSGATNIKFENFTIDTSSITPPSGTNNSSSGVIKMSSVSRIVIRNIYFNKPPRSAIRLTGSEILVQDCNFVNGQFYRVSVGGNNNRIVHNNFYGGPQWAGIGASGSNCIISQNSFSQMAGTGANAIEITLLSHSIIQYNFIDSVQHYGIYGQDSGTHDNAICNNTIQNIGMVGGQVVDGSGSGIVLWPGAHHNLIADNTIPECLGYGVVVAGNATADSTANIISNNTITDAGDPGIAITKSTNNLLRKNTCNHNYSVGIVVGDEDDYQIAYATGTKLFNNHAENNMLEGFYIYNHINGNITGNVAYDNGFGTWTGHVSAGIQVRADDPNTRGNLVLGNTAKDIGSNNQAYGIYLGTYVNGNTIQYNDLYNNVTSNLFDNSGRTNTITNNRTTSSTTVLQTAPPIADTGYGAVIDLNLGSIGNLDASATHLMTGTGGITYSWQQIYGPTTIISNANTATTTFSIDCALIQQCELVGFRLTASNSFGSTIDEVYFAVLPKRLPQFCGDDYTVYLPGDINKDCYVDMKDLYQLVNTWLDSSN